MSDDKKCTVRMALPHEMTRIREILDRDGKVVEVRIEKPKEVKSKK